MTITLSDRQFCLIQGISTEDAWNYFLNAVSQCQPKYILEVFANFKGAFDYLSWDNIMRKLHEVGYPELALWSSYFSDRQSHVVYVRDIASREVTRGCTQGSISGPFLWNLMMDSLLKTVEAVALMPREIGRSGCFQ